jgi:glycerophosphoryl diester phosphodiesterase
MVSRGRTQGAFRMSNHLKASSDFPENTSASFVQAIRDGAEGIESGNSYLDVVRSS